MGLYTNLERKFIDKAEVRGNLVLFLPKTALAFINESEKNRIRILGIDGFYLTQKTIQPSMEHTIDLSAYVEKKNQKVVYKIARDFILERINEGLHFEVVTDESLTKE